jgi:hypothetical protein
MVGHLWLSSFHLSKCLEVSLIWPWPLPFFFSFLIGIVGDGVQLGPLGTAATNRPIVPALGDYDDGEIGGMIGRGNRSTRRKLAPLPLCPPQTPHAARTRTRTAVVGSQRLTAWATARPLTASLHKIFHLPFHWWTVFSLRSWHCH